MKIKIATISLPPLSLHSFHYCYFHRQRHHHWHWSLLCASEFPVAAAVFFLSFCFIYSELAVALRSLIVVVVCMRRGGLLQRSYVCMRQASALPFAYFHRVSQFVTNTQQSPSTSLASTFTEKQNRKTYAAFPYIFISVWVCTSSHAQHTHTYVATDVSVTNELCVQEHVGFMNILKHWNRQTRSRSTHTHSLNSI